MRTLSIKGRHPSWTLDLTSAGTHSFVFQHPDPVALIPHSWPTRTTNDGKPASAAALPSMFSHTHFDSG